MSYAFTPDELTYYARHFSLEAIGISGQQKLKDARVLCVGAGGLGCPLLLYLAAAGVGTLAIVDGDCVEISNLHRQVLYCQADVGALKSDCACQRLAALNPHITLHSYPEAITPENSSSLIAQYDIVVDCTDNFTTRYLINDVCFEQNKPNVQASIAQFQGQCSVFTAEQGPCYRCLFDVPPPPTLIPNCATLGVMGVLPGILGSLQAMEVIKLITGVGTPLIGRLLTVNALTSEFHTFTFAKNPACTLCRYSSASPAKAIPHFKTDREGASITPITAEALQHLRATQAIFLLDVREPAEYAVSHIGGHLIPLGELTERLDEINPTQSIVVYCQTGKRSQTAVILLKQLGFANVSYLKDGLAGMGTKVGSIRSLCYNKDE